MGPRPSDRGNLPAGAQRVTNPQLQWGHDHLIVEIRRHPGEIAQGQHASMGPRPSDRGNPADTGQYASTTQLLQWGHDHLIVEIGCVACSSELHLKRFNGATTI